MTTVKEMKYGCFFCELAECQYYPIAGYDSRMAILCKGKDKVIAEKAECDDCKVDKKKWGIK